MIKRLSSILFSGLFYFFRLFPINHDKVFVIMTYDTKMNGNIKNILKELKQTYPNKQIYILSKTDYLLADANLFATIKKIFVVFLCKSYHLATSKTIILNNIFNAAAYLKFNPKVEVIQVWHAVGYFKRFGEQFSPNSNIDSIQKKANRIYTYVTVNAIKDIPIYAQAFHISEDRVLPIGNASSDPLFNSCERETIEKRIRAAYPEVEGKKTILYAPTFRENPKDNIALVNHIKAISSALNEEYVLLLRIHPYIRNQLGREIYADIVIDVSMHDDVNELLVVADILVTDYSSIIFEYSILERPMIFFAYDLEQYQQDRGFYHDYKSFVPGTITNDVNDLISILNNKKYTNMSKRFKEQWHDYDDGNSAKRFIRTFFN